VDAKPGRKKQWKNPKRIPNEINGKLEDKSAAKTKEQQRGDYVLSW